MTQHNYAYFGTDWFRRLMEYLDGRKNGKRVSVGEMRKAIEPQWMAAIELLIAHNHACHAGILTEAADGVMKFNRDTLERLIDNADDPNRIRASCVFDCERNTQ